MTLNERVATFVGKIRPPQDFIDEANRQVDFMIERLQDVVAEDGRFRLLKIIKAGSNAKFTSLLETEENVFDVDLGAYYSGVGASQEKLDDLLSFTRTRLIEIYDKPSSDFEPLSSAIRVKFRSGIELWVDVAPIIEDKSLGLDAGGWLPRDDGWRLTSVTCHNEFVSKRTAVSAKLPGTVRFNRIVRCFKWWNNLRGELTQPSIFCELVTAAAVRERPLTADWMTSLINLFGFVRRHGLSEPIIFDDYYDSRKAKYPGDVVVVLDSVNPSNNIAHEWTERTRTEYLAEIEDAYLSLLEAKSAEADEDEKSAIEMMSQVFGDRFEEQSEEDE
jgi:hypothetical protein